MLLTLIKKIFLLVAPLSLMGTLGALVEGSKTMPRGILESFLSGVAFDHKESYLSEES